MRTIGIARQAVRTVVRFRGRYGVMAACAFVGVASFASAVSYASAGRQKVADQLTRLGANLLVVTPAQSRSVGGRARTGAIVTTLVDGDLDAIRREVPDAVRSSGTFSTSFLVKAGDLSKNGCAVVGVEPDFFVMKHWAEEEGRPFETADVRRLARSAILGAGVRRDLFGDESPIGARLFINRTPFEVVGVLAARGPGADPTDEDGAVYVPLSTVRHRLMNVTHLSSVVLEAAPERMGDAEAGVRDVLARRHRAADGGRDDFQVQNQRTLIETQGAALLRLGQLARAAGAALLALTSLGVVAIGWLTVNARAVEIGTRRAVGAAAGDIFLQVALEMTMVSVAGAGWGAVVGRLALRPALARASLPASIDSGPFLVGLAVSLALNAAAGLASSARAARVDPMRAMAGA